LIRNKRKYREREEEWLEREIGVKLNVKDAFRINKKIEKLGAEEEHYAK
jgi:hypothetical protein